MTSRTFLAVFSSALLAVACADSTGPPGSTVRDADRREPRFLRWPAAQAERSYIVRLTGQGHDGRLLASTALASSTTATIGFWAVRGRDVSVQIDYRAGEAPHPFVRFRVPAGALAYRPDGSAFADGDSVLISLAIDSVTFVVQFEPSGLVFNADAPAVLDVWYGGTGGDLDADGDVDDTDATIETKLLGVWYQAHALEPWSAIAAEHVLTERRFTAVLAHFSGYALSW